jgi:hypothetical protein
MLYMMVYPELCFLTLSMRHLIWFKQSSVSMRKAMLRSSSDM